ncbi:tetratricopeptide repeat protein [Poriferisphaera corsica]|nr:hypothetical protein [Poriferisphaera corsica]
MNRHRIIKLLGVAGILIIGMDQLHAQQAVNQSGQALDANQQIGTGGLNEPRFQEDYRLRNDLVTDNVPGLRGFRGVVGYTAPGVFGFTNEDTDPLFRFRAQSLASSPSRLDAVQIGRSGAEDYQGISIYGTFTDIPPFRTGDKVLSAVDLKPGVGYQVIAPTRTARGVVIETDEGVISYRPQASTIGISELPQSAGQLEVQASPLLGVRQYLRLTNPTLDTTNPEFPTLAQEEQTTPEGITSVDYRVEGTPNAGVGTLEAFTERPAQIAPGLRIGQQLQTQITQQGDETEAERIERLEDNLFNPPLSDRQAKPGDDVYADLLNAAREQNSDKTNQLPENTFGTPPTLPDDESQQQEQGNNPYQPQLPEQTTTEKQLSPLEQAMYDAINKPSEEEVEAEEEKAAQQRRRLNIPSNTVYRPRTTRPTQEQYQKSLDELMNQLDYNLPRIETLAGTKNDRFNRELRTAEKELSAGRYFAAEDAYRRAVRERPENPLARIGLIHAQLGAGLVRSSAHNLRLLFEQKPQLIAARYNPKLLPTPQRVKWVQGELENMIREGQGGADPGLMLAYLGYQIESKPLVRYGLAVIERITPTDPLVPVLRRIWLDEKPQLSPAEPTK